MTQPDPEDPLREQYGDYAMVQSREQSGRVWSKVESLNKDMSEQKVRQHVQCGGGAALLKGELQPIAEGALKTACVNSILRPRYVWRCIKMSTLI